MRVLRWAFQLQHNVHTVCVRTLQELTPLGYEPHSNTLHKLTQCPDANICQCTAGSDSIFYGLNSNRDLIWSLHKEADV